MSASTGPCPDSVVLESLARGHRSAADDAHLTTCRECRRRVAQIRADNEFLSGFLAGGIAANLSATPAQSSIDVPGYDVTGEIHRGGQGVVYQAVQRSTKRNVAIKVMKQGPLATLADRARFEREIETLGRLDHPNIVAVHDAGTVSGFQYLVMDFVDGPPLDEAHSAGDRAAAPRETTGSSPRALHAAMLATFTKVCDAVHAAHLRGVIHRDLKPSNIRVDRDGEPHVLDFGLATSTEIQRAAPMTHTGQFVGSLPWASPEQAEGVSARIDLRTDVYSLGVILFQLLTGRMPFDVGSNLPEAFDLILRADPPRPSSVADAKGGAIDDELDTIVLKCLEKDRERRYQSAGELARDIRRYLAGEAIEAKRDSAIYVIRKLLRRYRYPVAGAIVFVVLLVVFGASMAVLYQRSARLEHEAVDSASALADLLSESNVNQGRMAGMLGNLLQSEALLWRELLTHREAGERGAVRLNEPPGEPAVRWALWELYRRYPCRRTMGLPPVLVRCATLAEDGSSVWVADANGQVQRINVSGNVTDSFRVPALIRPGLPLVDRKGNTVLWTEGARLAVWFRNSGERPAFEQVASSLDDVTGFGQTDDGPVFVCAGDGIATLWNVYSGAQVSTFVAKDANLVAVAVSEDGSRVAARDDLGRLYIWDARSGEIVATTDVPDQPIGARHIVGELLFSPDGRYLADAWIDTPGRVWDLHATPLTSITLSEAPGDRRTQCFSPDGRLLAVGDLGGVVRVFDARTGARVMSFVAHADRVWSICFTADGRRIWTSAVNEVRHWDFDPDAGARVLQVSGDIFHGAEYTADGRQIIAGGLFGQVQVIDVQSGAVSSIDFGSAATISAAACSPDGRRAAVATYANALFVWDDADWERPPRNHPHPHKVSYARFSPDGARIASACDDGVVRVWRTGDATLEREFHTRATRVPQVTFSPDGRHVAAALRDGALQVWDITSGECDTWREATGAALRAVRFSTDGRQVVVAGAERAVEVWDVSRRMRIAALEGHNQEIYCLDISRDGKLIVSGDAAGVIHLWDGEHDRPLVALDGHAGAVMSVAFAPDGRSLVSASLDGTLRIWNLGHFDRHIAGNVDAQLQRLHADEIDPARAAAWREWAATITASTTAAD